VVKESRFAEPADLGAIVAMGTPLLIEVPFPFSEAISEQ